ncbi:MAG TPA: DUF1206 domain-containing protein [Anaeromyxobacteraceae bacterium]|nr:DUF1206 domain-containing protein [Anaeromyxobacteraceae bacterium]
MPTVFLMGLFAAASSKRSVSGALRTAARQAWFRYLARVGFYAKALVYLVIGLLALGLALGAGGELVDSRGAITAISEAPLGAFAVAVLGVSLAGLGLWFIVDGLVDPDRLRTGRFAWVLRLGQMIGGIGYLLLATWAFAIFFGEAATDRTTDELAKSWTGHVLGVPGGTVLVFVVGTIVAIVGARQVRVGIEREFLRPLDLRSAAPAVRRGVNLTGRVGFVAQGLVFALVGLFFVQAAIEREAYEATGFDGALGVLARQRHGAVILACVSLGLLAYAAFAVFEGHFRRYGRR